jgi:hypothetical protein
LILPLLVHLCRPFARRSVILCYRHLTLRLQELRARHHPFKLGAHAGVFINVEIKHIP